MLSNSLRNNLAALFRVIAHYGWDDLVFSHCSARIDENTKILLPRFGLLFSQLTSLDMIEVDI
ncbi:MAG: class II aldolase/adducin family protein, partial [Bdellovibrionaceae bacterium]|nr:class II aldolase/adducin family protein [Pseudobdellovibrionaceae bacterium]